MRELVTEHLPQRGLPQQRASKDSDALSDSPAKRYLTILEISQKQAYIFASNKLKDNAANSAIIAWIMNPKFFEEKINDKSVFSSDNNEVYSGGGHTVLEFASLDQAKKFTKTITFIIHRDYSGIEVYAKTIPYQEKSPEGEIITPGENLRKLTQELEKKKSQRRAVFHQGSFGIEKIDTATLTPVPAGGLPEPEMPEHEKKFDDKILSGHYKSARQFDELGGDKDHSNFIAVVHIDGNSMGKRMEELYEQYRDKEWEEFKEIVKKCSREIDEHFKEAYKEMADCVKKNIESGKLDALKLKKVKGTEDVYFPVRRIITAGDDICFVAEGRIGLECAEEFLKALGKKQNMDGKGYAACAGAAIVHQKYPFFRAYELAEKLCKNAKKLGPSLDADLGNLTSAIDWHIEYGEIENDSIEEIRRNYWTKDGNRLEMRPYIVSAPKAVIQKEPKRQYANFKKLIKQLCSQEDAYARGKIKELKSALKKGELQARHFLQFNKIESIISESYYGIYNEMDYSRVLTGQEMEKPIFIKTSDRKCRTFLFDAIEMMDTYIGLEE